MAAGGNSGKRTARFPLFPRRLGNLAKAARFPHFHSADDCFLPVQKGASKRTGVPWKSGNPNAGFPLSHRTDSLPRKEEPDCYKSETVMLTTGPDDPAPDETHGQGRKAEAVYTDLLTRPLETIAHIKTSSHKSCRIISHSPFNNLLVIAPIPTSRTCYSSDGKEVLIPRALGNV
jgi:hypothetical protein